MPSETIKVLFSETSTEIFPTVNNGFLIIPNAESGASVTFELESSNFDEWRSVSSSSSISDYSISDITIDEVYSVNTQGVLTPANGNISVTVSGTTVTISSIPNGMDGIEFEYTVTVSGNGKTGSLDPRARGKR